MATNTLGPANNEFGYYEQYLDSAYNELTCYEHPATVRTFFLKKRVLVIRSATLKSSYDEYFL